MGQKKERLRQDRLEHNITQFSYGRGVLRSGGPNHINHHVHRVHLELTTKRLKAFPIKKTTVGCCRSGSDKSVAKPLRQPPSMIEVQIHSRSLLVMHALTSFFRLNVT
jgi:hypothetical protein